jgi:hypothetical protein
MHNYKSVAEATGSTSPAKSEFLWQVHRLVVSDSWYGTHSGFSLLGYMFDSSATVPEKEHVVVVYLGPGYRPCAANHQIKRSFGHTKGTPSHLAECFFSLFLKVANLDLWNLISRTMDRVDRWTKRRLPTVRPGRKQKVVSLSSTESEYIAASEAAKDACWLRMLLRGLTVVVNSATPLLCDNNSAIVLANDQSLHACAKHIDVHYHHIRDCVEKKKIRLSHVHTDSNTTDTLTKALPHPAFIQHRSGLGVA